MTQTLEMTLTAWENLETEQAAGWLLSDENVRQLLRLTHAWNDLDLPLFVLSRQIEILLQRRISDRDSAVINWDEIAEAIAWYLVGVDEQELSRRRQSFRGR